MKELDYDVEYQAGHTGTFKLETGDYVCFYPFALVEELIEEHISEPDLQAELLHTISEMALKVETLANF